MPGRGQIVGGRLDSGGVEVDQRHGGAGLGEGVGGGQPHAGAGAGHQRHLSGEVEGIHASSSRRMTTVLFGIVFAASSPAGEHGELLGGFGVFVGGVGDDRQARLTGHGEYVPGDVDSADQGVPERLAAGAVLVDVMLGPVLPEVRAERRQFADQGGDLGVEGVPAGLEAEHGRIHSPRQRPVEVEGLSSRVQEDEPSHVGSSGVEVRGEQRPAHQVGGDEVLSCVVDDRRCSQIVQDPLHRRPHDRLGAGRAGRPRGGRRAGQVEQMRSLDVAEPQRLGHGVEHALGGAADVAALQSGVVVEADSGQFGDLLPPQTGHPAVIAVAADAGGLGGHVGATGHQKILDFLVGAHASTVEAAAATVGCPDRSSRRAAGVLKTGSVGTGLRLFPLPFPVRRKAVRAVARWAL